MRPMDDELLQEMATRIEHLIDKVGSLTARLDWFLDPEPDDEIPELTVIPGPDARVLHPSAPEAQYGDVKRLKWLRPKAWEEGRAARVCDKLKRENPYRDTRGGYRNAWFGGFEEMHDELEA